MIRISYKCHRDVDWQIVGITKSLLIHCRVCVFQESDIKIKRNIRNEENRVLIIKRNLIPLNTSLSIYSFYK